jgi:hypothetical protein
MQRTCSVAPYGEGQYKSSLGPNNFMMEATFCLSRRSGGAGWVKAFTNMTPNIPGNNVKNKGRVDASVPTTP